MKAHCLQHVAFEGLGSIEVWLDDVGATLTTTRFFEAPVLPAVDDLDLVIVMGGPMSVNDTVRYEWLTAELRFIRQAIDRGVAVLGICLGAQLIAKALGARVYPNSEREIGWFPIVGTVTKDASLSWSREGVETVVFHWHGETFDLPPGATQLARSQGCEQQAFQIGDRVVGLQFHLEATPSTLREMTTHGRSELTASRFVQSEADILSAGDTTMTTVNSLLVDTLNMLAGARGGVNGRGRVDDPSAP